MVFTVLEPFRSWMPSVPTVGAPHVSVAPLAAKNCQNPLGRFRVRKKEHRQSAGRGDKSDGVGRAGSRSIQPHSFCFGSMRSRNWRTRIIGMPR
jgi:hypothetical protein